MDSTNFVLWANLSAVLWNLRSFEDALSCAKTSLQLNNHEDPKSRIQAYLGIGNACTSLGQYDIALKAFDEASLLDPLQLDAKWNKTLLLLLLGDYTSGLKDFDLRIDWHHRQKNPGEKTSEEKYKSPQWDGEDLTDKSILVLHDQGYGDTILYSRFLSDVRVSYPSARKVYVSTVHQLAALMWEYQRQISNLEFVFPGAPIPQTDYHVHIGSLPRILGITRETIPEDPGFIFIRALAELALNGDSCIEIAEPKVQPAIKVGVCWSGRKDFARNDEREIPLRLMLSLAENPHIWLYSLQMPEGVASEIEELGANQFIQDLSSEMHQKGWIGTATAILGMDIVVTCCTSIAHLASILGKPTWVLLHTEPYWIWGHEGSSTPWYPSARLFRQRHDRRGDWTCVLEEVRSELSKLVEKKMVRK
jgi:tetratricopeptide (TPR) repeat protein